MSAVTMAVVKMKHQAHTHAEEHKAKSPPPAKERTPISEQPKPPSQSTPKLAATMPLSKPTLLTSKQEFTPATEPPRITTEQIPQPIQTMPMVNLTLPITQKEDNLLDEPPQASPVLAEGIVPHSPKHSEVGKTLTKIQNNL